MIPRDASTSCRLGTSWVRMALSLAALACMRIGSLALAEEIRVLRQAAPPAPMATAPENPSAANPTSGAAQDSASSSQRRGTLDARCADGSLLKVRLLDGKIPLKTDYGLMEIPVADILRIDFATRQPDDVQKKVRAAIERLGADEYEDREAASVELLGLPQAAYPALIAIVGAQSDDAEVLHRAEQLVDQIRKTVPGEELEARDYDVIYTSKSQMGGKIDLESLKVDTGPFGQQQLKLLMLRRVSAGPIDDEQVANVLPDPGSLTAYQAQVGKTYYFRVSGAGNRNGFVWGTDVYTLDSTLSMAAMHAGLLQPGQTKVIGVTILGPQNAFAGSTRNGITSSNWSAYPGGFRFKSRPTATVVRPVLR
jgi:hypothetical protein